MGRKSTIEGLPDAIRKQLDKLLLDKRVTVQGATHYVNDWLAKNAALEILPDGSIHQDRPEKVSKSAVGRYKQSFDELAAETVEQDRIASLMIAELGISNDSNVGKVTAELLRGMVFKFLPMLRGAMSVDDLDVKELKEITQMINSISVSHERLEYSATINQKRIIEIEKVAAQKAKEQAAAVMIEATKALGLDDNTAKFWREKVLQGGV